MATMLHGGSIATGAQPADVYALIDTGTVSNIVAADISSNAITADKILANAITTVKIADDAITADKIDSTADVAVASLSVLNGANYMVDTTDPATGAATSGVYSKSGELYHRAPSSGNITQITSNGNISGSIVQTVNTSTATEVQVSANQIIIDDTVPQITESNLISVLDTAITPSSTSNKLRVQAVLNVGHNIGGAGSVAQIYAFIANTDEHATNALCIGMEDVRNDNGRCKSIILDYYVTAPTTNETTYRIYLASNTAGTIELNQCSNSAAFGGAMLSSVTITEIAA